MDETSKERSKAKMEKTLFNKLDVYNTTNNEKTRMNKAVRRPKSRSKL